MIFFVPAAILVVIGYFIKYKQVSWLISGYNTASQAIKDTYDLTKLSHAMGNFCFLLAGFSAIIALTSLLFPDYQDLITIAGISILGLTVIISIITLNYGQRLRK